MIGLIGYQDEVIGFGLAGISKIIEVTRKASEEEVISAIEKLSDCGVIMINESLLQKVKKRPNNTFIEIPEDLESSNVERIEQLTKETLGI